MRFFSYVVSRDYGFAPNPFHGLCTLATCKAKIRNSANIGDWIFGTGSVSLGCRYHLIYAMKVTGKMTYNEYSTNKKYTKKKPIMHGSLVQMNGDNIYYKGDNDIWLQADSHHSNEDGSINHHNLNRDTKSEYILISDTFYYFGKNYIKIPNELIPEICILGQGYKCPNEVSSNKLLELLEKYTKGYHGNPIQFENFIRHDGINS